VYVVKAGPTFEVLAKNPMNETCLATRRSPVVSSSSAPPRAWLPSGPANDHDPRPVRLSRRALPIVVSSRRAGRGAVRSQDGRCGAAACSATWRRRPARAIFVDVSAKTNLKWKAEAGSTSYATRSSRRKVFLRTNNDRPRNPAIAGDKGVLNASASRTRLPLAGGQRQLETGMENDWPEQGVCSSPAVEGKRLYYVTNRAELVCLDTDGFTDGENDGPTRTRSSRARRADLVWKRT